MKELKECFVCWQGHLVMQRQIRDKVTAGIKKLKEKHSTALLTVEDLSSIYSLIDHSDETASSEVSD